jgi:short-subunit dehydrogenase
MKLNNKTVLITGASSGIGKAFALKAAQDKAHIILAARNLDKLNAVKLEVEALGSTAEVVVADVTKIEDIRNLFLKATANGRVLDVVFDNAGLGFIADIWDLTAEQIQLMLNVNTVGMIEVAKFAAEIMQRQKYGHIIMTSSLAGLITMPQWSVYVASKWAITGFSECIRAELKPYNVKVTTLHPGIVNTEFFDKEKANVEVAKLDKNALTPEQVAQGVYDAIFTDQKKIILPESSKSFALLQKYLPGVKDLLIEKMLKDVDYGQVITEDEPEFSYVKSVS